MTFISGFDGYGEHRPSLTVVCCQLLDSKWKLEVEAMAAR